MSFVNADGSTGIIIYEELNITTITLIIPLEGQLNKDLAFWLLPVRRLEFKEVKDKLPRCYDCGDITSMRWNGHIRGVTRLSSTAFFRNSVTVDISTSRKNVCVKLSSNKIQMCGASCKQDGQDASMAIVEKLRFIDRILTKTSAQRKEVIEWAKVNVRGDACISKKLRVRRIKKNRDIRLTYCTYDFDIVVPTEIPKHFDPELVSIILDPTKDVKYYSDYCYFLDVMTANESILVASKIDVICILEAMVNYNYSLGFDVDLQRLNVALNSTHAEGDIFCRYDNALSNNITIEIPYHTDASKYFNRHKDKIPHHTFIIYNTGSVTQSGPGGEEMRRTYYRFMNLMVELKLLVTV